jgi:hypothetical protein
MNSVHNKLKERIEEAVMRMQKNHNQKRKPIEPLKKGDVAMWNGQNIRAKHRCKKWEDEMLGPFQILSVGSNLPYWKLTLRDSWKIHPVFNIDLLEQY